MILHVSLQPFNPNETAEFLYVTCCSTTARFVQRETSEIVLYLPRSPAISVSFHFLIILQETFQSTILDVDLGKVLVDVFHSGWIRKTNIFAVDLMLKRLRLSFFNRRNSSSTSCRPARGLTSLSDWRPAWLVHWADDNASKAAFKRDSNIKIGL